MRRTNRLTITVLAAAVLLCPSLAPAGDIDWGRVADQALREQHMLVRAVVDGSPDLVLVRDLAGTYVLAHAYGPQAIANALEAGVASIEHGNFLNEETAAAMKEKGAWLVPTLVTYEMIDRQGQAGGVPEVNLRKIRQALARGEESLRIAVDAGLSIGSGSDLLGPMQPHKTTELTLKARVMGNMGALLSATSANARLFRMEEEIGTVEEGKLADLIAVGGNPVEDIAVLEAAQNVKLVMKQGTVLKRLLP